jgi:outer membrane assembly lipoprotein YfiO
LLIEGSRRRKPERSRVVPAGSDRPGQQQLHQRHAKLKALESRYPFGRYADQAQLELIYANYKNAEPEAAKSAAERFIRLHPQHPNVDYAYYLKGLTSFDQDVGLLARFLPLDMTKRDPAPPATRTTSSPS